MNYLAFIKIIRPHQFIKNLFIFAGLFFSGQINNYNLLFLSFLSFLIFCLASASVYVFNDIIDLKNDINHPEKKLRPLPQKLLTVKQTSFFGVFMFILSLATSSFISFKLLLIISAYFLLQVFYTLKLKKIPVIDVFCIALGFILRMLAGTAALNIRPSHWIIICTMMISIFLGFCKRYSELKTVSQSKNSREVLKFYSNDFLKMMLSISASSTLLSYALYTINSETLKTHGTNKLIYTVPFVFFGIIRYLFIITTLPGEEDTAKTIIKDRQLLINIIFYFLSVIFILKGNL